MSILNYKLPFGALAIICYLCTVITAWSYGNSYPVYVVVSVFMAIFSYFTFFSKRNKSNKTIKYIIGTILFASLFVGFINGDLKSSIMVNISLLMPFSLSTLNISYRNIQKQVVTASLVNLAIIFLISRNPDIWNSNSLAFTIFCGITIGMIWFKVSHSFRSTIFSSAYLLIAMALLLAAGSRNAGIVILICYAMLLAPKRIYQKGIIYRTIYITILLLTVFSVDFQMFILDDDQLMEYLLTYTTSFSNKEWGMDTHYLLLQVVTSKFANLDLFSQLFGRGIKVGHCHNLYYQCLFFYGYIGTFFIYIFYVYIFEKAYQLIKRERDILAMSCFIILIGHFMLQISEVYMLGTESANIMSLLPAAIILQRCYKFYKK